MKTITGVISATHVMITRSTTGARIGGGCQFLPKWSMR